MIVIAVQKKMLLVLHFSALKWQFCCIYVQWVAHNWSCEIPCTAATNCHRNAERCRTSNNFFWTAKTITITHTMRPFFFSNIATHTLQCYWSIKYCKLIGALIVIITIIIIHIHVSITVQSLSCHIYRSCWIQLVRVHTLPHSTWRKDTGRYQ